MNKTEQPLKKNDFFSLSNPIPAEDYYRIASQTTKIDRYDIEIER